MSLVWVALGGACGAVMRFSVSRALVGSALNFPLATLMVNVCGSFLIGLLVGSFVIDDKLAPGARLFFQTGLLGAFTTFSAFSLETMQLWQSGQSKAAVLNVVLNMVLCLAAVTLGLIAGSALGTRIR